MKMFSASDERTGLDQERVKLDGLEQFQQKKQQFQLLADIGNNYGSKTISYERNDVEDRGDDSIIGGIQHGKSTSYDCMKDLSRNQGGQLRYAGGGESSEQLKNQRLSEFSRNRKLVQKSSITAGFMSSSKKEDNNNINNRQSRNWIYDSIKKEGFEMLENRRNQQIITDGHSSSSGLKLTDLTAESYQKSTTNKGYEEQLQQQMLVMNKENHRLDYQLKEKDTIDSRDLSQKNVGESLEFMRKWRSITRGEERNAEEGVEDASCGARKITEERVTTTEDLKDTLPRKEEIISNMQGQNMKGDTVVSMEWSEQKTKGQLDEKPYGQMMRFDGDIVIRDINTSRVRKTNSEEKQQSDCWMKSNEQSNLKQEQLMKLDINQCKLKLNVQDKQYTQQQQQGEDGQKVLAGIKANTSKNPSIPYPTATSSHISISCNNQTCKHEREELKSKLTQEELKVEQLTRLLKECQSDREAWRQQLKTIDQSNSKVVSTQIELEQLTHTLAQEKYTINKLQAQILALQAQNEQLHKINASSSTSNNNKNSSTTATNSISLKKTKDREDNISGQVLDKGVKDDDREDIDGEGKNNYNNNNNNNAVYTFASDDGEYTLGPSALRSLDRNPVELSQQRNISPRNGLIRGRENQQIGERQPQYELGYQDRDKDTRATEKRQNLYENSYLSSFGASNFSYNKNIPQGSQIEAQHNDQTIMKNNHKTKNFSYDLRSPLSPVSLSSNYASLNAQQTAAAQYYPKSLNGSYYKHNNDENNNINHHTYLQNSSKSPTAKQDTTTDPKRQQYNKQVSSSSSSFYSNYDKNLYMQPVLASDIAAKRSSGFELYSSHLSSSANVQSRRPFRNSFYY